MSREPSPPAGGSRQWDPSAEPGQRDGPFPLGNQVENGTVQAEVKASLTDIADESANGGGVPVTGHQPPAASGRTKSAPRRSSDMTTAPAGRASGRPQPPPPSDRTPTIRPSLDGGLPALQRELGAHGRETVRRLLEAGRAEFEEAGLQGARVEDIVRRAKTSHGTFYLYFANKDDLFRTLLRDALVDMSSIADDFPVVTSNEAGRTALRRWVHSFSEVYAAHSVVIRILSQADVVGENAFGDGLHLLFRVAEAMTQGMTAAGGGPAGDGLRTEHAELTAVACLMMLERINYLMSAAEVHLPREEMIDRITAIIYAAFRS
jgi:AcrR family transcriptional regulator